METKNEMTEAEFKKWLKSILKQESKFTSEYLYNCGENSELMKALTAFMDKYPILFADNHSAESRKFIKWVLQKQIEQTQSFIDRITQIEKEYNLPLDSSQENYDDEYDINHTYEIQEPTIKPKSKKK
jgi:hypothetical protein